MSTLNMNFYTGNTGVDNMSKLTFRLVASTGVAVVGNSFLYGYNMGVLNTPAPIIREFYNATYGDRFGSYLTETTGEILWATTNAIFVAFGMIGSFLSAKVGDLFGRKKGMMLASFVLYLAALLSGLSRVAKAPEMLIVSRALVGLHSGCVVNLAGIYLAEISPKSIRGSIGTCHQVAVTTGIFASQILGSNHLLGSRDLWPMLTAVHGFICFASTIGFFFCPESPRFLLIKKGHEDKAVKDLRNLRGVHDVSADINDMKMEARKEDTQETFTLKMLLVDPTLRLPLLIAVVIQIVQQWSGINAVFAYSNYIFEGAGVSVENRQYAIMGTGAINVVATIICVPLMEKLGRRPLLVYPMGVMIVSLILLTVSINLQADVYGMGYLSIVSMHIYVVGFAVGLGPIPYLVVCELFRQAPRSTAMSFALFFQWMCAFILIAAFRFIQEAAKAYTFLIFAFILAFGLVFVILYVPETKNKSFDEIAQELSSGLKIRRRGQAPDPISRQEKAKVEEVELLASSLS